MTSEQDVTEDIRHAAKMAKKKAARDRMIAEKSGEKGLIIVHTGAGKGKSSSAFPTPRGQWHLEDLSGHGRGGGCFKGSSP